MATTEQGTEQPKRLHNTKMYILSLPLQCTITILGTTTRGSQQHTRNNRALGKTSVGENMAMTPASWPSRVIGNAAAEHIPTYVHAAQDDYAWVARAAPWLGPMTREAIALAGSVVPYWPWIPKGQHSASTHLVLLPTQHSSHSVCWE